MSRIGGPAYWLYEWMRWEEAMRRMEERKQPVHGGGPLIGDWFASWRADHPEPRIARGEQ